MTFLKSTRCDNQLLDIKSKNEKTNSMKHRRYIFRAVSYNAVKSYSLFIVDRAIGMLR